MAEILSGERPSIDIQLLDPDRYARLSATSAALEADMTNGLLRH